MARIVVFGATGYTGRLTAESLLRRGVRPVLAARSADALAALASELGGALETATADVSRPESVRALVERGDVLVSTVGPFTRWGEPAVRAALDAGAHYVDSTGEGAFIRRVFEEWGASAPDVALLTAMGFDWVPGNLAGGMALAEAGPAAVRVDVGYFMTGPVGTSGGTRASAAGAMLEPTYAFRDGAIRTERGGARVRSFDVRGRGREALSVGSTEAFSLPRVHPALRDVDVYLGVFGPATRAVSLVSTIAAVPFARETLTAVASRLVKGSTGGPDKAERAKSGTHVVAVASDAGGAPLATVHLEGANAYSFTGDILAWAAQAVAGGALKGTGALGPVEAFGLDRLREGCAEAGITRV
jgi:short subunit dehydrogenase-like uncharacterized protein